MKGRIVSVTALVLFFAMMSILPTPNSYAADKYVIKLATSPPYVKGSPQPELMANFKKLAEEYSEGKIEVQIFWGGQLGTEQKVVKDTQLGIIQMSQANVANFSPFCAPFYSLALPAMFKDRKHGYETLTQKGLLDYLNTHATEQAGIRVLVMYDSGYRALFNTRKPVKTPEDMEGLKWRVPNNPVFIEMYKSWGVEPIPMAWGEVFSSLQTGVIEGGDNTLHDMIDFKFYEVAKAATESKHILQFCVLGINEKFFQKLPKDLQDVLVKAGKEAWAIEYEMQGKDLDRVKEELRSKGMIVDEPDVEPFLAKAREIVPSFADKMGGQKVYDEIMAFLN